jgi:hypothetical protein
VTSPKRRSSPEKASPSFNRGQTSTQWSQDYPGSTAWCRRVTGTVRRTSRSLLWSRWRRRFRPGSRRPDRVCGLRRTRPIGPGIRHGSPSRWW